MTDKQFGVATKGFIFKHGKLLTIYKTAKEAGSDPNPNLKNDQPGGRVEFGEDPNIALIREIKEETGLTVSVISPFSVWHYVNKGFQLVGINFLCEWCAGEVCLSKEHENYEWLALEEIIERHWWNMDQYINAFTAYKNYRKLQQ